MAQLSHSEWKFWHGPSVVFRIDGGHVYRIRAMRGKEGGEGEAEQDGERWGREWRGSGLGVE